MFYHPKNTLHLIISFLSIILIIIILFNSQVQSLFVVATPSPWVVHYFIIQILRIIKSLFFLLLYFLVFVRLHPLESFMWLIKNVMHFNINILKINSRFFFHYVLKFSILKAFFSNVVTFQFSVGNCHGKNMWEGKLKGTYGLTFNGESFLNAANRSFILSFVFS